MYTYMPYITNILTYINNMQSLFFLSTFYPLKFTTEVFLHRKRPAGCGENTQRGPLRHHHVRRQRGDAARVGGGP